MPLPLSGYSGSTPRKSCVCQRQSEIPFPELTSLLTRPKRKLCNVPGLLLGLNGRIPAHSCAVPGAGEEHSKWQLLLSFNTDGSWVHCISCVVSDT